MWPRRMVVSMRVDRLPVLLQIIDSTEELQTRGTLEWLFSRVLSYMTCKMLRSGKGHRTSVVPGALERFPSSTLGPLRSGCRYTFAGKTLVTARKNTGSITVRDIVHVAVVFLPDDSISMC